MNQEILKPSIEKEPDKTVEQVLEDLIEESLDSFLQIVIAGMIKRFQGRESAIVAAAMNNLDKEKIDLGAKYQAEGKEMEILDMLKLAVNRYLENN